MSNLYEVLKGSAIAPSEKSLVSVFGKYTDDGKYMQFKGFYAHIITKTTELIHINENIYFCSLKKLGIIDKKNKLNIPPLEIYEQMKGKKGKPTLSYYRKKEDESGNPIESYGLNFDTIDTFLNNYEDKIITLLKEIDELFTIAEFEATERYDEVFIKEQARGKSESEARRKARRKSDIEMKEEKSFILENKLGC